MVASYLELYEEGEAYQWYMANSILKQLIFTALIIAHSGTVI